MLKKNKKQTVKSQFGLVRYQVQRQVQVNGMSSKDSTEAFGCEERVEGAQAILKRLVAQEVASNKASRPETQFINRNVAVVTCNTGLVIRFAVVRINVPRK